MYQRPYQLVHLLMIPPFNVPVERVETQLKIRLKMEYAARANQPIVDAPGHLW